MQVSIKWLKDYIDFTETPEELADKLTMAGIPVENVVHTGEGLEKVVVGKLTEVRPHENSDHLQICTVDVAKGEPLTIVTGAPNVQEGQLVPVALVGAHLPNGQKIEKSKMRGVLSMGMLCSAEEMRLDLDALPESQKNGIYILPEDTTVGVSVKDVLGLDDVILEFELTANRADCFSVLGLVREISVLTGNPMHFPEIKVNEDDAADSKDLISVSIQANDLCRRFSAGVLKNVKIGPSPKWMQQRLEGAGIRSINNVVDVTNFVMIELGQPMHAYDYDEITGHSLTARKAVKGENLHTLDDSSRVANGTELVIADAEKPAGLAGIMGGLESEITEKTTTVVLEAASFYGPNIRRTARSCGLHSEASGRFERGVDVTETPRAIKRASQLLQEMGACTVCKNIVDVYPEPVVPVKISFTASQINCRLGTKLSSDVMCDILKKLGFGIETVSDESYTAVVPSWRNDVTRWEDLSEEVAQVYGFDEIPSTTPHGRVMSAGQSKKQYFIEKMKAFLCSLGLDETASFAFTHPSMYDKMQVPEDSMLRTAIPIMNPLTDEYPLVRTTLLSSVFENVVRNLSRKNEDVRLFEIAPVFYPKSLPVTELPDEVMKAAGIITGRRAPLGWNQVNDEVDFYDLKGIIEELLTALSIKRYTVEVGEHYVMHPGKTAVIKKGNDILAYIGEVHPAVAEAFSVKKKMYAFEMDVLTLMKHSEEHFNYTHLPKYPAVSRDLALLVDRDLPAMDIEKVIKKNAGPYFKEVCLFDVYTGKQVDSAKKSVAFSLLFQSNDKTLTDAEVDEAFGKIVSEVEKLFGAELRA